MRTLEITFPDEVAARIEQAAQDRGVSLQDLVASSVVEKLQRDGDFESAVAHVLTKNAELYKRLS